MTDPVQSVPVPTRATKRRLPHKQARQKGAQEIRDAMVLFQMFTGYPLSKRAVFDGPTSLRSLM